MEEGQPTRQLHGYVSADALAGWQRFGEAQGVNVTALLEAVGQALYTLTAEDEPALPRFLRDVVAVARRIGSSRSTRRSR